MAGECAPGAPDGARPRLPGFWIVWLLLVVLLAVTMYFALARPAWRFNPHPDAMPDMRLDLNAATAEELNVLPGIGPNLSERIIADRNDNGPFETIEDLDRVSGIGARTIESIRPYVVVNDD